MCIWESDYALGFIDVSSIYNEPNNIFSQLLEYLEFIISS